MLFVERAKLAKKTQSVTHLLYFNSFRMFPHARQTKPTRHCPFVWKHHTYTSVNDDSAKRYPKGDNGKKRACPNCFHTSLVRLADTFCPKKVPIKRYVQSGEIEKLTMLTGCINGLKSEENRYFTLKTSKLRTYLHVFELSFTWVCSVKALLLPANLNAFSQKTGVKKDCKADNSTQRIDTHDITKLPHISRIYNKQGCCSQIRQR